jgi:hypothetical protein
MWLLLANPLVEQTGLAFYMRAAVLRNGYRKQGLYRVYAGIQVDKLCGDVHFHWEALCCR